MNIKGRHWHKWIVVGVTANGRYLQCQICGYAYEQPDTTRTDTTETDK